MRKNRTTSSLSRSRRSPDDRYGLEIKEFLQGPDNDLFFLKNKGDPFTDVTGPSPESIRDPGSSRRYNGGPVPAHTLTFRWPAMSSAAIDDGSGTNRSRVRPTTTRPAPPRRMRPTWKETGPDLDPRGKIVYSFVNNEYL